jgi:hypothetical protein
MIGHAGFDADGTDVEAGFFELFDFDVGGDFLESDGKKRAFHLTGQDIREAMTRAFVAENAEAILFFINGEEKWKALNVIPMSVSEEKGHFHWGIVELDQELATQGAEAGAAVENDDLALGADFDAGGIAAVADGGGAGSGDGATDAPEL